MEKIPDTPIYCTAGAVKRIEGQYGKRGRNFHAVKTGDNILFSNDAFGRHYALPVESGGGGLRCHPRTGKSAAGIDKTTDFKARQGMKV